MQLKAFQQKIFYREGFLGFQNCVFFSTQMFYKRKTKFWLLDEVAKKHIAQNDRFQAECERKKIIKIQK